MTHKQQRATALLAEVRAAIAFIERGGVPARSWIEREDLLRSLRQNEQWYASIARGGTGIEEAPCLS